MLKSINRLAILKTIAMPQHLNPSETIFGGWLISKMDLAGGISAWDATNGKIRTVSCNNIMFHKSVQVADIISYYTNILRINNSSITIKVDAEVYRMNSNKTFKALDGYFTYVAIDKNNNPRQIIKETSEKS